MIRSHLSGVVLRDRLARSGLHCRKHASAPLLTSVAAGSANSERFRTSAAINYERTTTNASDGSIHRYYDPATGQFISSDPLVDLTGQPYAYAGDNPVNATDPLGLSCGSIGSILNPFSSGSCFKSGWEQLSGKQQLADITLPITLPLTALAAVTGVGALAGVGVLGATEGVTAGLAAASGATATAADLAECLGLNDKAACVGAGIGSVGLGGVWLGLALGGETIGGGLAAAFGFAIGSTGSVWDLLSQLLAFESGGRSASSPCAPRT
ncbi:MAG: RHS repeat-associated core domain-containing protein [Acidimicrobiales bacterium]